MPEININQIHKHLKTISACGIDTVTFDPCEDDIDKIRICGVSSDCSLIVFARKDNDLSDLSITVFSITVFLSRLALFDLSRAEYDIEESGQEAMRLNIRQGKKKASHSFIEKERVEIPKNVPRDKAIYSHSFSEDHFAHLQKAIQSMQSANKGAESFIIEKRKEGKIYLKLSDGASDIYEEELVEQESTDTWSACWKTKTVKTVLKEAFKHSNNETVRIDVGRNGLGMIEIDGLIFSLVPHIEE